MAAISPQVCSRPEWSKKAARISIMFMRETRRWSGIQSTISGWKFLRIEITYLLIFFADSFNNCEKLIFVKQGHGWLR